MIILIMLIYANYVPGPVSERHRTNRTQTLTQTLTLGRNPNPVSPG